MRYKPRRHVLITNVECRVHYDSGPAMPRCRDAVPMVTTHRRNDRHVSEHWLLPRGTVKTQFFGRKLAGSGYLWGEGEQIGMK